MEKNYDSNYIYYWPLGSYISLDATEIKRVLAIDGVPSNWYEDARELNRLNQFIQFGIDVKTVKYQNMKDGNIIKILVDSIVLFMSTDFRFVPLLNTLQILPMQIVVSKSPRGFQLTIKSLNRLGYLIVFLTAATTESTIIIANSLMTQNFFEVTGRQFPGVDNLLRHNKSTFFGFLRENPVLSQILYALLAYPLAKSIIVE